MILRRRPQQARPADVDHLDGVIEPAVRPLNRLLKRVEVDHHHVDGLDALFGELAHVLGIVTIGENGGVDPRVQRLDPAVQHLRKTGHRLDWRYRNAGLFQMLRRAAGRDNLDAELLDEGTGEVRHTGLVVHRNQCPADPGIAHGSKLTFLPR